MRGIIDRLEENIAVVELEDNKMVNIERYKLPEDVFEGAVIIIQEDSILIDYSETEKRRKKAEELIRDIFQ